MNARSPSANQYPDEVTHSLLLMSTSLVHGASAIEERSA
jgi:hypothetical protein